MNLTEFRKKVNESEFLEKFKNYEVNINYPSVNYSIKLKGLNSIYGFVFRQYEGWNSNDLPTYLNDSKDYFRKIKTQILELLDSDSYGLDNKWSRILNQLQSEKTNSDLYVFTFDSSESKFLIDINNENPNYVNGAYSYLCNINISTNNIDSLNGILRAYEFKLQGLNNLKTRKSNEKASISSIRNSFESYVNTTENQIDEVIQESKNNLVKKVEEIDVIKDKKDSMFSSWFKSTTTEFDNFYLNAQQNINTNEELYREKLRLEAPANYWNKRAIDLKNEGQKFLTWLIILVVFAVNLLFILLFKISDGNMESVFNNNI